MAAPTRSRTAGISIPTANSTTPRIVFENGGHVDLTKTPLYLSWNNNSIYVACVWRINNSFYIVCVPRENLIRNEIQQFGNMNNGILEVQTLRKNGYVTRQPGVLEKDSVENPGNTILEKYSALLKHNSVIEINDEKWATIRLNLKEDDDTDSLENSIDDDSSDDDSSDNDSSDNDSSDDRSEIEGKHRRLRAFLK